MADSENTRTAPQCTTTRRAFLGSSAAAISVPFAHTLPAAIAEPVSANSDAELLALGRTFGEVRAELHRLYILDDPRCDEELWNVRDHLITQITDISPHTGPGMAVLLKILYEFVCDRLDEFDGPTETSDMQLTILWKAIQAAERMET